MDVQALVEGAQEVLERNTKKFNGLEIVVPALKAYPVPYCWDTAFHVMALCHLNPQKARENVDALLLLQREDGLIPNAPLRAGDQDLRSQPPIIFYAVKKYFELTGDLESVRRWFPKLVLYYEWWSNWGDPAPSLPGLVAPFSGVRPTTRLLSSLMRTMGVRKERFANPAVLAICSTGMDNHPTYDFAEGRTIRIGCLHYLALEDLLLNSALVAGAEVLAELAALLNKGDLAARFQTERRRRATLVNEYMWDEEDCFYFPVQWSGVKVRVKSIQAFAPLWAGIPKRKEGSKLLGHLSSPGEFWGRYGVPTVAFDDPKHLTPQPDWMCSKDPYYWRGTIWAPTTVLTFEGLRRYQRKDLARDLALKWMELVKKAGFAEYFYPEGRPGKANPEDFGWTAAATVYLAEEILS
jgi:glycogen debranching enzyme